ncbi:MAG: FtsX-like permease family protein [Candidatus Latescibacterota bacterium]|nr:FtsX-like permease family protein [Candidatus Latescibacterota bacterium]
MSWVLRMAWRDSRGQRRRLLLFTGAIAVGVTAFTSLRGLSESMAYSVDQQSAVLMGADMEVESRRPFTEVAEALFDSIGGEQSRIIELNSMVLLPSSGGTRLAQVRGIHGGFPYYGDMVTEPTDAAHTFQQGRGALVDEGLLLQFGNAVGDSVRVGTLTFEIVGRLKGVPGETALRSDVQPRVFIPLHYLDDTGLIKRGSRVEYIIYFYFGDDGKRDVEAAAESLSDQLEGVDVDTVEDRKRQLGRSLDNLYRFLGFGSFVALLLGAVGIASAVHSHVQQKLAIVAILRSLGASSSQALWIYLLQATAMGLAGSALGTVVGVIVTIFIPDLVADFIPSGVTVAFLLPPVFEGLAVGTGISLLFAALPLVAIRSASPLLALRASYESIATYRDRALRIVISAFALLGTLALARLLTGREDHALIFTGGSATALALLALTARLLRSFARRFFPHKWSYAWRHGVANMYRPHNQTLLLLVSLGMGSFLVACLYTAQSSILAHIDSVSGGDQPNVVIFDIQSDQAEGVAALVRDLNMPVIDQVPIVTMYLAEVKDKTVQELSEEPVRNRRGGWTLFREYRVTYRGQLSETETVLAGQWKGTASKDTNFISLEDGIAKALGVTVGDSLVFDVQGLPITVVVSSLRKVEWQRIMPNFLVVFSTGILETAPQFHVLVTRAADSASRARLQRELVQSFPNLSIIDLDLVLRTADSILEKVGHVVRFMSLFSVATGLVVLVAAVSASRFHRLRESALLRTLGAHRKQVLRILLVEYACLGSLGGLAGMLLALAGAWGLTTYVFEVTFQPSLTPLLFALAVIPILTVGVGISGSRGIHTSPPLQVLRSTD